MLRLHHADGVLLRACPSHGLLVETERATGPVQINSCNESVIREQCHAFCGTVENSRPGGATPGKRCSEIESGF